MLTWPCPVCSTNGVVTLTRPGHRIVVMDCPACHRREVVPLRWAVRYALANRVATAAERARGPLRAALDDAAHRLYPGDTAWS